MADGGAPLPGPFDAGAQFFMLRPQKPKHPDRVLVAPDADKLLRAVGDALEGMFWANDSQVEWNPAPRRHYAGEQGPGLTLTIEYLGEEEELF